MFDTALAALTTYQMIVLTMMIMEINKPTREVHIDALPYFLASSIWLSSAALDDTTENILNQECIQVRCVLTSCSGRHRMSVPRGILAPGEGSTQPQEAPLSMQTPPPVLKTLPSF